MNLTIPPGTRDKVSQPEPPSDGTACIKLLDIISRPPPLDLAFRLANPPSDRLVPKRRDAFATGPFTAEIRRLVSLQWLPAFSILAADFCLQKPPLTVEP